MCFCNHHCIVCQWCKAESMRPLHHSHLLTSHSDYDHTPSHPLITYTIQYLSFSICSNTNNLLRVLVLRTPGELLTNPPIRPYSDPSHYIMRKGKVKSYYIVSLLHRALVTASSNKRNSGSFCHDWTTIEKFNIYCFVRNIQFNLIKTYMVRL